MGFFSPLCGVQESWAETDGPLAALTEAHAMRSRFADAPLGHQAPFTQYARGFFDNVGLNSRMLKGWKGARTNLGAACCSTGFGRRHKPAEGLIAERLKPRLTCQRTSARHPEPLGPFGKRLRCCIFPVQCDQKRPGTLCICLYKSSGSGACRPTLLSALNLWIFSRICFPSLFLEEIVNEIMQQCVNCDM